MLTRKPLYTKVEHARLGTEIYEQRVSSQLSADQFGKIVAIDVESGEFEVADQTVAAAQRLMLDDRMLKSGSFGLGTKAFTVSGLVGWGHDDFRSSQRKP